MSILFQSTLLQEERLSVLVIFNRCNIFQSTLLQEERLCGDPFLCTLRRFQSTLLQEERHCVPRYSLYPENFNPRSYKRSDADFSHAFLQKKISIHAPTRGATLNGFAIKIRDLLISIHAPTRGATYCCGCDVRNVQFQSTLLQEERRGSAQYKGWRLLISIHAPTRGATKKLFKIG